jgi:hypothetical protein
MEISVSCEEQKNNRSHGKMTACRGKLRIVEDKAGSWRIMEDKRRIGDPVASPGKPDLMGLNGT